MDISFTAEQKMLASSLRSMLGAHFRVRDQVSSNGTVPSTLWKHFTEAGFTGLTLPVEYGGGGATAVEMAIMAEELGRANAPLLPIISSVLCGGLLNYAGTAAQKSQWLPALANGSQFATMAWLEPGGGFEPHDIGLSATRSDDAIRLLGRKTSVGYADQAHLFLVPARLTNGEICVCLVEPGPGIRLTENHTLAGEIMFGADFDLELPHSSILGPVTGGWPLLQESMVDAAIAFAAYSVGGARQVHEWSVLHAKHREQFGSPLGAFQAIAHRLVDDLVAIEGAWSLAYETAWARAQNKDCMNLAALAKNLCSKVFRDAAASAHQVHGGIGFTTDLDLHLYFRRAKQLQLLWWDDKYTSELVAAALLDEADSNLLSPLVERWSQTPTRTTAASRGILPVGLSTTAGNNKI
ncbi:alkylation response protein AidB-like acyl-CoA dehydrogenase [Mycobacteroides chelonae]|nr:alkylation response protein AidB-like acyl-CoA dehydrogenase [Mycobacteroides chelonae]